MIGKALEYDLANTIVEDSEPERAAEAAKEKEARRGRKKRKQEQIRENNTNPIGSSHAISAPDIIPGSFFLRIRSSFATVSIAMMVLIDTFDSEFI